MDNRENIKIFIGSGEASLVERKTLIYSLHKHTKRKLLDSAKFLERIWPSTSVNGGDVFGAAMWWDLLCAW